MNQNRSRLLPLTALVILTSALAQGGLFHHRKYENPITKDTLQPDKVLFDRAIKDIEHGRYEVARLTLNTLINTYDSSEYLAKAKLAIADSWYREGGAHGLTQAEAEYKDFELFYPTMEESAEAQWRICQIHYRQMDKPDRDPTQAQRSEDECRQLLVQYPNSKYADRARQMLRETQEVLGEKEFRTAVFYQQKGAFPAAANRATYLADQYPLYSNADSALWQLARDYKSMGDRFEQKEATVLARLVRDYPLSGYVDDAKQRLTELKRPIPEADAAALARMKYEQENRSRDSLFARSTAVFRGHPSVASAARSGDPAMATLHPPTPVSVPVLPGADAGGSTISGSTAAGGNTDVSVSQVTDSTNLDSQKDARAATGQAATGQAGAAGAPGTGVTVDSGSAPAKGVSSAPAADATTQPFATNHPAQVGKKKKQKKTRETPAAKPAASSSAPPQ